MFVCLFVFVFVFCFCLFVFGFLTGPGVRYSEFVVSHPKPPPLVGQHTVEILKGMLRYEDDAIEELLRTGVVAQHEVR
mgnify:CR=1 FL=1